ncbi:MAG: lipid-A-disaccharide synthase [Gemmatimonadaceae bacterium]
MREILFVAGETSGDLHAAGVAAELKHIRSDVPLAGVGGDRMRQEGVTLLAHAQSLAVMGFTEVLTHIPKHWALLRSLTRRLRAGQVGLVVLIDYPGFNMKLAGAARRCGVPVLYYITPQVWAWGAKRLAALARTVSRAAVILPFEEALLRAHGVHATFVGHPLLDRAQSLPSREEARSALGLATSAPVLALFPGSRAQEIHRHLEPFVATAHVLKERVPSLQVVVSVAPGIAIDPLACPYPLVRSASFDVLRAADAAFCKSGTSTLEAAVADCPLAVGYRTGRWTYAVARRVVTIPYIGLVNVVAEREVAPEFVQGALVPERVADALQPLLSDTPRRQEMQSALAEVRARLGTAGAARRVAAMALELLDGS